MELLSKFSATLEHVKGVLSFARHLKVEPGPLCGIVFTSKLSVEKHAMTCEELTRSAFGNVPSLAIFCKAYKKC